MSKRTRMVVGLILGSLLLRGTMPAAARSPQSASILTQFTRNARLQPRLSGSVTVTLQGDSRQGFEKIAALGAVQVIFHRQFTARPLPQVTLNATDLADALDQVASLAGAFWETYDSRTILVGSDKADIRKQVEAQLLTSIALPTTGTPKTADLIAAIRMHSEFKQLAVNTSGKTLLVRDTPENVARAQEVVAEAGGSGFNAFAVLTDLAGNTFTRDQTGLRRTLAPSHAALSPNNTGRSGLLTVRVQDSARASFQALADRAGVQVYFHRWFTDWLGEPLTFEGVDFFTAMDILCFKTGNFWLALDQRTIVVAMDTPVARRELDPVTIKAFNIRNLTRQQEITEAITASRTLVSISQIAMSTPQRVLVVRDTAEKIALTDWIFAEFDRGTRPIDIRRAEIVKDPAFPSGVFAFPTDPETRRAMVARLKPKLAGPYTIRMNQPSRQAFETLTSAIGIQVVFHPQFQSQAAIPFALQNADLGTALDRLAMLTGSFWTVSDPHTIVVTANNDTPREVEPVILKAMEFGNLTRQQEVTEAVTALRTLLSFSQIAIRTSDPNSFTGPLERPHAIMVRETADKIALAEKILAIFDSPLAGATIPFPDALSSGPAIPSGLYAIPTHTDTQREMRQQLQVKAMPTAISFNQPSRKTFETLAAMAGVPLVFDRQFVSRDAVAFACDDCDFFSAMDRLSFETGNFWFVSGARSVVVAPDTPAVRREVEEMFVKTIYFNPAKTQQQITEAITALRSLLTFNQIGFSTPTKALVLRDTADKAALAEKVVAVFDPKATFSASFPSGVVANPMDREERRNRFLAQLQLRSAEPISASFNQSSHDAFETLAGMAGVRVEFHPLFVDAAPSAFRVDGVNWVTAMDALAFQTGTFWIPQGPQTILVAPDNPATRRAVIGETTRNIEWKNSGATPAEVTPSVRTLTSVRDIQPSGANAITVTDLPDVVALVERIVASIDVVPPVTANLTTPPATTPFPPNAPAPSTSDGPDGPAPMVDTTPGSIAGQVRSNDGVPVRGVRVSAVSIPAGRVESVAANGETDASGAFKLERVPPGRYTLRVDSDRFPYPTYFPSGVSPQEGQIVTVTPSGMVEGLALSASDALPLTRFGCFERNARCFDLQQRFTLEGVMKQVFVQNPALKAVLTVRDELGPRDLDLVGPNVAALTEKGFSQVKVGDRVKVVLSPRRDGGSGSFLAGFVKADGTEVMFQAEAPSSTGATGSTIRINFQPPTAPAPAGYLVDGGAVFGDRGNGYRYGWTKQNASQDRNAPNAPDQRYDTLAHLQIGGDFVWELEVPNGFYSVRVVAGDPIGFESLFIFSVEGAIAIDRAPSSDNRWLEDTVRVSVSDGRLTIGSAVGACNNKLAFVEVTPVASGPPTPTPKPTPPTPTFMGTAHDPSAFEGRHGVIAGVVGSSVGAPLTGVRVSAMSVEEPGVEPTLFGIAQTDESGRYLIDDLPNGRYHVVAGAFSAPLFHPGIGTSIGATVVTASDKPATGVNFFADRPRLELVCPADTGPKR